MVAARLGRSCGQGSGTAGNHHRGARGQSLRGLRTGGRTARGGARRFSVHWHAWRESVINAHGTPNGSDMPDTTGLAELIAEDFYNDRCDLSARGMAPHTAWSLMPEVEVTQRLRGLGASDRSVRVFLTLVSAMDRARDAARLWHSAVRLFESHPEVFGPARVTSMAAEDLSALVSQSGVSQRHGPDTAAWRNIAGSLVSGVGRRVPAGGHRRWGRSGVVEGLAELRFRGQNPLSHASGGPKLRAMWVRIMANPGGQLSDGWRRFPSP